MNRTTIQELKTKIVNVDADKINEDEGDKHLNEYKSYWNYYCLMNLNYYGYLMLNKISGEMLLIDDRLFGK